MKTGKTAYLVVLCVLLLFSVSAYAEESVPAKSGLNFDNNDTIQADTAAPLLHAFTRIRTIGTVFAVIGLAGNGIQMMSDTLTAGKAMKRIIYILIALAGLWLLPVVIRLGRNVFGVGWAPESLQFVN